MHARGRFLALVWSLGSCAASAACKSESPSPVVVDAGASILATPPSTAPPTSSGPVRGAPDPSRAQPENGVAIKTTGGKTVKVVADFNRRVKMRDDVELSADVYRPEGDGKYPVILTRTPYNKADARTATKGRKLAAEGYVYVAMDVRGRGDSDGEFWPYFHEGEDGYDAIEWAAAEPWSSGKVGTIGGSYPGCVQWLAAVQKPPHLASMVVMVVPSDPFAEWPTGVPLPTDVSWYHLTAAHVNQSDEGLDWMALMKHLPLVTMDDAAGRPNPRWKEMFDHAQLDSYWDKLRYQDKFDQVNVPVFHVTGWYDDEQVGTPKNFAGMITKGPEGVRKKQHLLVGPWGHHVNAGRKLGAVDFGDAAVIDLDGDVLKWFDATLKDAKNGVLDEPRARYFVMGENRWAKDDAWPLPRAKPVKYYLRASGGLSVTNAEGAGVEEDHYTYDPADPTPFITAPTFAQLGGPDDYRDVERRKDVLVYTSEPLKESLFVCGPIQAKLFAASSAKDTDFMAMLLDVWPNGYAQRLIDGMVRARFREGMETPSLIDPGKTYEYTIDMWNTCQAFKSGHRVRLQIASAGFPKYDRNLNTGEPLGKSTAMLKAEQKVFHDKGRASYVILPVVPAK